MEPEKVIAIFLKWLHENPSIFTPTAWKRLPQLEEEIAESADDELFPIALLSASGVARMDWENN